MAGCPRRGSGPVTTTPLTAAEAGLVSCENCSLLSRPVGADDHGYCPRCGGGLEQRHHTRSSNTWALVIAAAICYIPANVLPVLTTNAPRVLGVRHHPRRVMLLYNTGSWPLALIVLIASVMVPLGKLIALSYLLISVQRGSIKNNHDRTRLYRLVEFIGRWSMLDVFVDTFTVALIQLQPLMSSSLGRGVLFFAAVVVLTMIAAETFEPPAHLGHLQRQAGTPWLILSILRDPAGPPSCPRGARGISIVWIIPILAAVVAVGIAVQRIMSEGPTITIVFKAAEGLGGRQDHHQVQRCQHRHGDESRALEGPHEGGGEGEDGERRGRHDGRGCEVLGRHGACHVERSVRPQHVAVGKLYRLRNGQVQERAVRVHGARRAPIITGGQPAGSSC